MAQDCRAVRYHAAESATTWKGKMRICKFCGISSRHVGMKNVCIECRNNRLEQTSPAHKLVNRAVVNGVLPHPKKRRCADCGKKATCYDHRDYSKPLDVVPLCQSCNLLRGHGKCKSIVNKEYVVNAPVRVEVRSCGKWRTVDAAIQDNGVARVMLPHPYGMEMFKNWRYKIEKKTGAK